MAVAANSKTKWAAQRDAILALDDELVIEFANEAAEHLYGIGRSDVLGCPIGDVLLGEAGPIDWQARISTSDEGVFDAIELHLTPEAVRVWVRAELCRRPGGLLLRARQANGVDVVTSSSKLIDHLIEAMEHGGLGVWIDDSLTDIMDWGPQMRRILGVPDDAQVSHEMMFERIHPEDRAGFAAYIQDAIISGATGTIHRFRVRHGEEVRHVRTFGKIVRDDNGHPLLALGALDDETELVKAGARIEQLEQELRQSQKMEAMGRLAGGIAHDFNNLLTCIIGYSQMLAESNDLPPARRADVGHVLEASLRATELTRELLAFSRKQRLELKVTQIDTVIGEFLGMLRRTVREDIRIALQAGCGWYARLDPAQLSQVVTNLVVNAADSMPDGGSIEIRTSERDLDDPPGDLSPGQYLSLEVSDQGLGISESDMAQIFDPFFTTKLVGKGTGLGLATVHGIVSQHGGAIAVTSAEGQGTTFRIYFPRVPAPQPGTEPTAHADEVTLGSLASGKTILLVEDEKMVRELAKQILEDAGFGVITAPDGVEALEQVARARRGPDVLLTDVIMPRMTGPQLVNTLRERLPQLPVLYVSGYPSDLVDRRVHLGPLDRFVSKPYSREALLKAVGAVLALQTQR